jgi:lysyl endopeptidase
MNNMWRVGWPVFVLLSSVAFADTPVVRMDWRPAPASGAVARLDVLPAVALEAVPITSVIELPRPSIGEATFAKLARANTARAIGFGRKLAPLGFKGRIDSPSNAATIHFQIRSTDAESLRVGLVFQDSADYEVYAFRPGDAAHAVPIKRAGATAAAFETFWSPVTDGDTQDLVVRRVGDLQGSWSLDIAAVSHIETSPIGSSTLGIVPKAAEACQVDVACLYATAPAAMATSLPLAVRAVARMTFTEPSGGTFLCTGTLLNSANYPAPFFLTAAHCISDASSAASLVTFWHYERDTCGTGGISPTMQQLAGGATLLYTNPAFDATLLGLNNYPPATSAYSGWDSSVIAAGVGILALHHPAGDVKKGSFGTMVAANTSPVTITGLATFPPGVFYQVVWQTGTTEPGSSGSGIFTYDQTKNFFYTHGTLTGGHDACGDPNSFSLYSEMHNYYPDIATPLTVAATQTAVAVEYYYAAWNYYFETSSPAEIAALDGGAFGGVWQRTGQTFNVWPQSTPTSQPTCRFFSTAFAPKSSHFYTPFAAECASIKVSPAWQYEGVAFYIQLADANGLCLGGTIPLYRQYNNGLGGAPNHRYTTSTTVFNQMAAAGWVFEGNGNTKVFACVPQ